MKIWLLWRACEPGGAILKNSVETLVRKPRNFLKKLQKSREIIDFTAFSGGLEGIRTLDLSDANRTLSQLSYEPIFV